MNKEIMFGLLTFMIIYIFFNNYYGKNLIYISETNKVLSIVNNQLVPFNLLEKEKFDIECSTGTLSETTIQNKINTIQYYTSGSLNFPCQKEFYKGSGSLNNLIDLQLKIKKVCYIRNTIYPNSSFFCSSK